MRSRVASDFASTDGRAQRLAEHERAEARTRRRTRASAAERDDRLEARRRGRAARRTSRRRGRGGRTARASRSPARSAAARVLDDASPAQRRLAGDRVVVLRQRQPDAHRAASLPVGRCAGSAVPCRGARVRAQRVGGPRRARCSTRSAGACGAVAARRAHRRRPPPVGVHPRRPRRRATPVARRAGSRAVAAHDRPAHATPACTRGSARSTSCRSSRSTAADRRRAVDAARAFADVGRRRRSACPVFLYDDADAAGAHAARRCAASAFRDRAPDLGPDAPAPALGAVAVGARPPLVAVNCELDRDDLALARADRQRGARARRRAARACGRSVSRLPSRRSRAGVDEPRRPRAHRARGRVPRRCGAAPTRRATTSRGSSSSGLLPAAELARCDAGVPGLVRPRPRPDDRSPPRAVLRFGVDRAVVRPGARELRRRWRAALERALAADPAPLPLGEAAPDPELLAVRERVLEALDPHLAARGTPPWPPGSRRPAPGRRGRDRPRGSWPRSCQRALAVARKRWVATRAARLEAIWAHDDGFGHRHAPSARS